VGGSGGSHPEPLPEPTAPVGADLRRLGSVALGSTPALPAPKAGHSRTVLHESILVAWRASSRATAFLIERLPGDLWPLGLPGAPLRSVRSIAVHLRNCRRLWMNSLAKQSGITLPLRINRLTATQAEVLAALSLSGDALCRLLRTGLESGGAFPGVSTPFVYGAMPRDAVLFCAYALSHEAHHRGQLVVAARALGYRLPPPTVSELWQWSSRLREATTTPNPASGPRVRRPRSARR